jgi:succinyl-CoA synthetase beta subunit
LNIHEHQANFWTRVAAPRANIAQALEIILGEKRVSLSWRQYFAGILRCDIIAEARAAVAESWAHESDRRRKSGGKWSSI